MKRCWWACGLGDGLKMTGPICLAAAVVMVAGERRSGGEWTEEIGHKDFHSSVVFIIVY